VKYFVPLILLLNGCGVRSAPKPNTHTASFEPNTPAAQFHDWAMYCAYAGGLLCFFGVIALVWAKDKSVGIRCFVNGFLFVIVSRLMQFVSCHLGWCLLLCVLTGILFNLTRVEKMLMKIGIYLDLNRDGKYGTTLIEKDVT